jgi:hypothetical protein
MVAVDGGSRWWQSMVAVDGGGWWQLVMVVDGHRWSLVGCCVSVEEAGTSVTGRERLCPAS